MTRVGGRGGLETRESPGVSLREKGFWFYD
jgi:hypothetical protein